MADPQGSVMEIIGRTYERGGLLAFFSGNEAGAAVTHASAGHWYPSCVGRG